MTTNLEKQQRQIERAALQQLDADFTRMAEQVGRMVQSAASGRNEAGEFVVPKTRRVRDQLKLQVWSQVVKPYFVGQGESPLVGNVPQSPYMRVIVTGIEACIRNAAEFQVALLKKYADPQVFAFLTGARPRGLDVVEFKSPPNPSPFPIAMGQGRQAKMVVAEQGGRQKGANWYDPFHLFVDENGYTLSDKGWRTALEVRRAIDALLDQQIPLGTSAVRIADMLVKYLVPGARGVVTRTPYGTIGSYWARRLARTEITAAAGRATMNMALANPFVDRVDWRLSASHPKTDHCDVNASGGPYALNNVPSYPDHPFCLCSLLARVAENWREINRRLREMLDSPFPMPAEDSALEGAFNIEWLIWALMNTVFVESLLGTTIETTP